MLIQKITPGVGASQWFLFSISYQRISQKAVRTSLPSWESVPVFLRKPIATCDFQGGPDPHIPTPQDPSMVFTVHTNKAQ